MDLSEENADIIGLNLHVLALCRALGDYQRLHWESFGFAWIEGFPTETKKKDSDSNLHPITLVLMVSHVQ